MQRRLIRILFLYLWLQWILTLLWLLIALRFRFILILFPNKYFILSRLLMRLYFLLLIIRMTKISSILWEIFKIAWAPLHLHFFVCFLRFSSHFTIWFWLSRWPTLGVIIIYYLVGEGLITAVIVVTFHIFK